MSCWFRVRCLDHKESPSFPFFRVLPWARHDPGGICHPCVMDEATRAQRDPVTCLGSHRSKRRNEITGLGLPCRIAEMRSIPQAFLKLSGCLSFGFSCSVEGARGGVPVFCGHLATLLVSPVCGAFPPPCGPAGRRPIPPRGLHVVPSFQKAMPASHGDILFSEDSVWNVPPL